MKSQPHQPIRTCAGCRKRAPRSDLTRLVMDHTNNRVVVDVNATALGRGAWVHQHPNCLTNCVTSLAGRLRHRGKPLDVSEITTFSESLKFDQGSGIEANGHPMSTS